MAQPGFVKAQSDNLPCVDVVMISNFFANNPTLNIAESRGVKMHRASQERYGDEAIGYVEICRQKRMCTIRAKICPEHKVRNKAYAVELIIDERQNEIKSAQCFDCAASSGGCKHAIAFLMWAHRRSEEPAPTSIACYWKRPTMSSIGTSLKCVTAKVLSRSKYEESTVLNTNFLEDFIEIAKARKLDSQITRHFIHNYDNSLKSLSLHFLLLKYCSCSDRDKRNVTDFLLFAKQHMSLNLCIEAAKATKEQSSCSLWYELRYGRITASTIYEATNCKTTNGSYVERVIGAVKLIETEAMRRGRNLEREVLHVVEKKLGTEFYPTGLILLPDYPIFGASPDSYTKDYIVEVKCPLTEKSEDRYICKNGSIAKKFYSQMQIQMMFANRTKGLFCVAKFDFETSKEVKLVWVDYDSDYTKNIISNSSKFWEKNIFPLLLESVQK
ncbi:uncharacterized protein LOC105199588 [Solenopsis invicta]|uniref:uncharacterized protein LOC105199588 n=1 Tax=Solenopsis invicta TaxID=13686 RepID=UPI0005958B9E|nr:uncharacterized protein LOC105199588 [Solenopsis invicta]XP_039302783.1 uncharacterized protein LOC120357116 [Solenopsis invicta]XP_039302785.1 uncharacterized protein LOC120357118 [Solenopsis invicta]XP_039308284.1 uncharacterized protein LOC105199588 [Solenopsis invicta]